MQVKVLIEFAVVITKDFITVELTTKLEVGYFISRR
jgi:hypothetical protein